MEEIFERYTKNPILTPEKPTLIPEPDYDEEK
jgi:hypothetical protein